MRLINQARDEHVATSPVTLADLPDMRAAFATNAVVGIRPTRAIDGTEWSDEHPGDRYRGGVSPDLRAPGWLWDLGGHRGVLVR
jgi:branched-subunit amino acid aminotransferase/4-amino-4-deoxychorismate lyase